MNQYIKTLVESFIQNERNNIFNFLDLLENKKYISEDDLNDPEHIIDKIELSISNNKQYITLHKIIINEKGLGNGFKVMSLISDYCDIHDKILCLTPDLSFGASSINRLKKFYKQFGFIDNKGRYQDFNTKESMIRYPEYKK